MPDGMIDGRWGNLGRDELISSVREISEAELKPLVDDIDRKGLYPDAVMHKLGEAGAYSRHLNVETGTPDLGLAIDAMSVAGEYCLSTSFCIWCHDTLAWYIANSDNEALKEKLLSGVSSGAVLGGTGLSNPMKSIFGIEKMKLRSRKVDGGYIVTGTLPWVSNLGDDCYFGTICVDEEDGSTLRMVCIDCSEPSVTLRQNMHFTALEGTRTFAIRIKDHFVPNELVIAHDAKPFVKKVRAGFILLQSGMAFGLIQDCIAMMRDMERTHGHINKFLPDQPEHFEESLAGLRARVSTLCQTPYDSSDEYFIEVLRARLAASELSLKASQAAMLHHGARGYLIDASAQRRLRESYFVAIVTPATKQLRKMLHDLGAAA
tara:strand:- start:12478 stop:13605 length:1128 start_codon:yes stop_codon:yes gene_type:complete